MRFEGQPVRSGRAPAAGGTAQRSLQPSGQRGFQSGTGPARPAPAARPAPVMRQAVAKQTIRELRGYQADELAAVASLGYRWLASGALPSARAVFEGLAAIDPADPAYPKALAAVCLRQGDLKGALEASAAAERIAPNEASVHLLRAQVLLASGHRGHARGALARYRRLSRDEGPLAGWAADMLEEVVGEGGITSGAGG